MTQLILAKRGKKILQIKLASRAHDSYINCSRSSIITLTIRFVGFERLIERRLVRRAASVAMRVTEVDEIQLIDIEGLVPDLQAYDIGFLIHFTEVFAAKEHE